jgi:peptide-methionine (R)-S-oxide reductase
MERRRFLQTLLLGGTALALSGGTLALRGMGGEAVAAPTKFEVTKTAAEWQKILSKESYDVLRLAGTEYPGTSPLLKEHRKGTFACAGCALPLFASQTKFESGTGWPSFWQPIAKNAVIENRDESHGMVRVEVQCRRCGGHLGHVFDDGPKPTGLRYCMNGAALKFIPAST